MSHYITVGFLKMHSRIDKYNDARDEYLEHIIDTAEDVLRHSLERDSLSEVEENGQLPHDLQHALLMLSAYIYENRELANPVKLNDNGAYWTLISPYIK